MQAVYQWCGASNRLSGIRTIAFRIGVHPNNLHLFLAERWPGAFAGLDAVFVSYTEGRDSARLLLEGRIDICGTGSTPPILARAAGADVRYVAASAPRPANGGIVAAPDGPIRTIADLVGRRVALLDGSFHTYLLARALEAVGCSLRDVTRVELSPAASLAALGAGTVDAWVAMAPLLDRAIDDGQARLILRCGDSIPNRSVFWTLDRRGVSAGVLDGFTAALSGLGRAIAADPARAAGLLAGTGADVSAWVRTIAERDWSIFPAGAAILAEQQDEADTLMRHGDLA